jgi:hypothetical protein
MDACGSCGKALAPDLQWCPRCYAPVPVGEPEFVTPPGLLMRGLRPPKTPVVHEFSRFRPGPTSMGWVGRAGASILLVVLACLLYVNLFGVVLGFTGAKYLALYLVVAGPALAYFLHRLWRPTRIS